ETASETVVETTAGPFRARVLIGADGSASRIARYVGVRYRVSDLGLEDEIPLDPAPWSGSILIDWGSRRGDYAWLFPKADSATIGVIERVGDPERTRALLAGWKERLGVA